MTRKRIGIFGWGVVGPKSPNIEAFEQNLEEPIVMLSPFKGFGPNNFMVGQPEFDFNVYKPWIDARFEPRKFAQLAEKMGDMVKYAVGAFIQALGQNEGMEALLQELGREAHVYVGTGVGDMPCSYEASTSYYKAWRAWNRFWCKPERNPALARYLDLPADERQALHTQLGAPLNPAELERDSEEWHEAIEHWEAFWVHHSASLADYLEKLREIEIESLMGDIETNKGHLIRKKASARRKLEKEVGCPTPPWAAVSANLLWNIANIPAAQITMVGRITGSSMAPVAACSGFITSVKQACNAIQLGDAKVCVVGTTDPPPHEMTVSAFFDARVISHDGAVSKPFAGLRGTHIAGGACIWIIGDYDYLTGLGMKPLGMEIAGIGLTSDAHHIITPNSEGPRAAIRRALREADVESEKIKTWDMHATATPGDWVELQNAMAEFPSRPSFTARKGGFGHGMSVCGGWELTAQHMGAARGKIYPVNMTTDELHEAIKPLSDLLVDNQTREFQGRYAGKINMGVGGVNACIISKLYGEDED